MCILNVLALAQKYHRVEHVHAAKIKSLRDGRYATLEVKNTDIEVDCIDFIVNGQTVDVGMYIVTGGNLETTRLMYEEQFNGFIPSTLENIVGTSL